MGSSYSRSNINGTSPMDLKNINDNFKFLWLKVFGDITNADISDNADINGNKLKEGSITAREISTDYLYAGKIKAEQIDGGEIVGCTIKTANSANFVTMQNQYISIYNGNEEKMRIGYDTNLNPDMCAYVKFGLVSLIANGYGLNCTGKLMEGGYQVLTESNWSSYISIPSGNYLPSTGNSITLNGHTLAFYSDGITYDGHTLQMKG
jgi:hypothetical protein